jgi:diadenosine tetraphosphate (Ap4A) HIT family hydrolase
MAYDTSNVFARILRGELPCKKVYESKHSLAFHDINPLAPVHVLVIPKGAYVTLDELTGRGSAEELADYIKAIGEVAKLTGATQSGYRILANNGENANQEVQHLHVHVFAGRPLGPMLKRAG